MSVFKFIKKIFRKKKKHQEWRLKESGIPLDMSLSEKEDSSLDESMEDFGCHGESLKEVEKKDFSVEEKEADVHEYGKKSRENIRILSGDEDLYELFTGEKNSGIKEPFFYNLDDFEEKVNIRRRDPNPQKKVDLHGLTSHEAEKRILQAVSSASVQGFGSVIFITGKGIHSEKGFSVLKDLAEKTAVSLKKKGRIAGFKWEKKKKSKSGAIVYYL